MVRGEAEAEAVLFGILHLLDAKIDLDKERERRTESDDEIQDEIIRNTGSESKIESEIQDEVLLAGSSKVSQ